MKKFLKIVFAATLAALLVALSACGGASKQQGRLVASYGNEKLYENELYYKLHNVVQSSTGSSQLEFPSIEEIKTEIDEMISSGEYGELLNSQKVMFLMMDLSENKLYERAKEQNLSLSEEEQAKIEEQVKEYEDFFNNDEIKEKVRADLFSDTAETDEQSKADQDREIEEYLGGYKQYIFGMYGVSSFEGLKGRLERSTLADKVIEAEGDKISDDEATVRSYYDRLLAEQQKNYEEDKTNLAYDDSMDETILYYPSGLRRIKHILIQFTEEERKAMESAQSTIDTLEAKGNEITEEEKKQLDEAKKIYDEIKAAAEKTAKTKADEVYGKLQSGGSFDELLKEYGEDPGMQEGSKYMSEGGYLVFAGQSNYVKEFVEGAMALSKAGEVSRPVGSSFGYHIIQYVSDVPTGAVPYEQIREELLTEAMESKRQQAQEDYFYQVVREIMQDGKVKIHYDALGISQEEMNTLWEKALSEIDTNQTGIEE